MGLHRKHIITINKPATDSSGSEVITGCGGRPAWFYVSAVDSANDKFNSDGWDDGVDAICNFSIEQNVLTTLLGAVVGATISRKSDSYSLNITNGGNGWTAKVSAQDVDGFTIAWTKIGAGRNIKVKILMVL